MCCTSTSEKTEYTSSVSEGAGEREADVRCCEDIEEESSDNGERACVDLIWRSYRLGMVRDGEANCFFWLTSFVPLSFSSRNNSCIGCRTSHRGVFFSSFRGGSKERKGKDYERE